MKITIFTTIPPGIYSGGRYLSLILAYSLSRAGAKVTYVTNNKPIFARDFAEYDTVAPIETLVTPEFELPETLRSDWVVVIPTGGFNNQFYDAAINHALNENARIALLSFETPNWFAAHSPFARSPMPTESWRQVIAGGGLVVSIASEGVAPARCYFGEGQPDRPRRFGYWHPALNDLAAASVPPAQSPRNKIVMFTRTEDPHKGAQDLLAMPPTLFNGHTLSLVFGRGVDREFVAALRRHFAPAQDFAIEVLSQITDRDKFKLLSEACLLLFPSYFEGYGYPPVEAAWMGVPTVAYDLPLLREVAGEAIWAAPPGDIAAFADLVSRSLVERVPGPAISSLMRVQTDTLTAGRNFLGLLAASTPHLRAAQEVPPEIDIARVLPGLNAQALALMNRSAVGLELLKPIASLKKGRLTVTGTLRGVRRPVQLVIDLPGGEQIKHDLVPDSTRPIDFAIQGMLGSWPPLHEEIELPISAIQGAGQSVSLGSISLTPDAIALLCETADGGQLAPGDTLVIADLQALFTVPRLSAALCELVSSISRRGVGRTTLLSPNLGATNATLGNLNLLPRFSAVSVLDSDALLLATTNALKQGHMVVLATHAQQHFRLHDNRKQLGARALTLNLGEGDSLTVLSTRLKKSGERRVTPDAQHLGRYKQELHCHPTLVLLPSAPISALPQSLVQSLRQIRSRGAVVNLVMPEELASVPATQLAGSAYSITPASRGELHRILSEEAVAGVLMEQRPEQHPLTDLFKLYGKPLLSLDARSESGHNLLDWSLANYRNGADVPEGEIAAALAPLLSTQSGLKSLPRFRSVSAPKSIMDRSVDTSLPIIRPNDVLSLSGARGEVSTSLLKGWDKISQQGAILSAREGVLAFRLAPQTSAPAQLEILLAIDTDLDPTFRIEVLLNEHSLGHLRDAREGVVSYLLDTPALAWSGQQQTLRLRCPWLTPANPQVVLTLVAISPLAERPPRKVFASHLPDASQMAPRFIGTPTEAPSRQEVFFGEGAGPGFLRLGHGWACPEEGQVWSDGSQGVLAFTPTLQSNSPILLTLQGSGFSPGGASDRQRLSLGHGFDQLMETLLPSSPGKVSLPLGASLTAGGLDHLVAGFPDAKSPEETGLGPDPRQLGLALIGAIAKKMPRQVAKTPIPPPTGERIWSERVQMRVASGVLRLTGSNYLPKGTRILLLGSESITVPRSLPGGGWEALLVLDAQILVEPVEIVLLWPESSTTKSSSITVEAVECWSADPPESDCNAEVLLIGRSCPDLAERDLFAQDWVREFVACARPALELPVRYCFQSGSPDVNLLTAGWGNPEPAATWSTGPVANISLPRPVRSAILTFEATGFVAGSVQRQRVLISSGESTVATLVLISSDIAELRLVLPFQPTPAVQIGLFLPDATSPAMLGLSQDGRRLGMNLKSMSLRAFPEAVHDGFERIHRTSVQGRIGGVGDISANVTEVDGLLCITLRGEGTKPLGVAHATKCGHLVVAHTFADGNSWQAALAIAKTQFDHEGQCQLRMIWTEADLEPDASQDLLCLYLGTSEGADL